MNIDTNLLLAKRKVIKLNANDTDYLTINNYDAIFDNYFLKTTYEKISLCGDFRYFYSNKYGENIAICSFECLKWHLNETYGYNISKLGDPDLFYSFKNYYTTTFSLSKRDYITNTLDVISGKNRNKFEFYKKNLKKILMSFNDLYELLDINVEKSYLNIRSDY